MAKPKPKKEEQPAVGPAPDANVAQKLQLLMAGLEKQYGKGIVTTLVGGSTSDRFVRQIPSGSLGLDIALGPMFRLPNGSWQTGFAPGRIIEIFGGEGSGKTTACLQLVANAQQMGIRCAYLDMEHALDPEYAKALGVNLQDLLVSQPSTGEECLNIAETLVKSGLYGLIVVDSVAALIPKSELEGEVGDATMGAQSRLMSQAMRMITSSVTPTAKNPVNIVFVNQIRMKIGVMFGNPETTTGGNALKFYAGYRIEVRRGDSLKDGENVYGQKVKLKVIKNKVAAPFRTAEFDLVYGKGIDYVAELFDLCLGRGLIQQAGAWFSVANENIGQGRAMSIDRLRNDRVLAYNLYNQLLTAVLKERGYNVDGTPIPGAHPTNLPSSQASAFRPLTEEEQKILAEEAALAKEFGEGEK